MGEFLCSKRRLFNRRGSDDSTYSTTSASQEPPKEGRPGYSGNPNWNQGLLNPEAQEFIPKTTESTSPVGRKTSKNRHLIDAANIVIKWAMMRQCTAVILCGR